MIEIVRNIILFMRIVIKKDHSKPDNSFGGTTSNVGLCLPPTSAILIDIQTSSAKIYTSVVCTLQNEPGPYEYTRHKEQYRDIEMIKTSYVN